MEVRPPAAGFSRSDGFPSEYQREFEGELVIAAPQLMRGYWNRVDETAEVLRRDSAGVVWLHTGDIGFMDQDGYLFLTARKKELIKVSGYQGRARSRKCSRHIRPC